MPCEEPPPQGLAYRAYPCIHQPRWKTSMVKILHNVRLAKLFAYFSDIVLIYHKGYTTVVCDLF